jgi:hypothetical protein
VKLLQKATTAVATVAALSVAMVFAGGASATAAGHGRPIHQVNIHQQYLAQLPKQRNQKKAEFSPTEPPASGTAPMTYHGGPIQQHPKVYLLLWGPNWSTDSNTSYLQNLIAGLGVQPQDDWSTSMSQYTDSSGNHPTFNGSVYAGTFQDTTTPPYGATQAQLGAEADAFYSSQRLTDNTNTQIVVATQDGTCPSGFYGSCNTSGSYCAWHSYTSTYQVPYTNLPYLTNQLCGAGYVNNPGPNDGVSIVEGHEYGETVTDPKLNAWYDTDGSGENGDKCAWTGLANVTLSTGTFAMQPLWSNSAGGCVMHTSVATAYTLAVSRSGTGSGTVTSSPSGINCGTTCSADFSSGSSVTLTATPASGSTFGGWTGDCSGAGTVCTISMAASRSVTATFNTSAVTTSQESSLSISYAGWGGVVDASANGGGYRQSNTTGGTANFKFSGTSVTWLARTGPDRGIASVTIDGVSKGTVDLYSASPSGLGKAFTGLTSATHTILVKVSGTKNASSTGTFVTVDGFTVGTTTTQESAKGVAYNKWVGASSVNASGGGYRSTTSGSSTFAFTGTGVDWITATGPGWGKAEVYVDNVDKGTVDLYASSAHWQTAKSYSGLSSGAHTLMVKALNTKNASATSTKVPIDAFVVH